VDPQVACPAQAHRCHCARCGSLPLMCQREPCVFRRAPYFTSCLVCCGLW
jgi:hypothetical protein